MQITLHLKTRASKEFETGETLRNTSEKDSL